MRPKSLLLLTLALGCGLVASIGISQVLDRKGGQGQATVETEPIFVAKTDINLGDTITEEVLNFEEWPKDKIPAGAMRDLKELVGRRPRTKVYQGEPILDMKLVAADGRDDPAQQVPAGFRVVSVRVDAHNGGAGLLRPGDRVDVQLYAKKDLRAGITRTVTKTILKEVRVFAVGQEFRRDTTDDNAPMPRTVSLVVTPQQADKLTLATRLGEINLIIRNPDDTTDARSEGCTPADLFVASKVNRDEERKGSTGNAFLGFMKGLVSASATPTTASPVEVTETEVAAVGPWTILLLEGNEMREVEVKQDGLITNAFDAAQAAVSNSGATDQGARSSGDSWSSHDAEPDSSDAPDSEPDPTDADGGPAGLGLGLDDLPMFQPGGTD
ncbi:MAG: Flp pilus assembly protein CpaB [Pirellulales bacterium]